MVIRIVLAAFVSVVSGFCYLAGLLRLVSGLLVGFGVLAALFFGVLFMLPPGTERLTFAVNRSGASWPFFLLALVLAGLIVWLLLSKAEPAPEQQLSSYHLKVYGGGLLLYISSLFIPAVLWFPSEAKATTADPSSVGFMVFLGVCLYLVGSMSALYLLYRGTKGTIPENPDLMRRFGLALFAFFQLDKMPALVAYLLVYSADPAFVFPKLAAMALAAYIPVGIFLAKTSFDYRGR